MKPIQDCPCGYCLLARKVLSPTEAQQARLTHYAAMARQAQLERDNAS